MQARNTRSLLTTVRRGRKSILYPSQVSSIPYERIGSQQNTCDKCSWKLYNAHDIHTSTYNRRRGQAIPRYFPLPISSLRLLMTHAPIKSPRQSASPNPKAETSKKHYFYCGTIVLRHTSQNSISPQLKRSLNAPRSSPSPP